MDGGGWWWWVEREGELVHPKRYPGWLTSFDVGSEEAVEGPDFWLKRSHTYQAREVQEPEKKHNKPGKMGAVEWWRWVGEERERAHPNR